jgi:hypothetical protein
MGKAGLDVVTNPVELPPGVGLLGFRSSTDLLVFFARDTY